MRRLLAKASALFILGIFAGSFIATPPITVDTETQALTQVQSAYPYLQAVSESQIAIPETTKIIVSEESINARFTGMLSHVKWLISGEATTDEDNEIIRLNKQILSLMDDIGDDRREDSDDDDDDTGSDLTAGPNGYILISSGGSTSWVATSSLGLTASATPLSSDDVIPDYLASVGQVDEYCLTYEMTGDTWEWQLCGSGSSSFATSSINTSLKLANIVTDETGTGALVFAGSPSLTGTVTAESANFSGTVGIGTTATSAKISIDNTATLVGGELVTNGTFSGSATGWTLGDCAVYSSNSVTIAYTACSDPDMSTDFTTVAGETYHLTFTLSSVVNEQAYIYFYENGESAEYGPFGAGTHTISFPTDFSGTETLVFELWNYNAGGSVTLDNVSVRQVSSDQASLAVYGYDGSSELLLSSSAANVALGLGALENITGGVQNVAIGRSAGGGASWMEKNVFVGYRAGEQSTGSENIFVGSTAGAYSTGGNNIFIGNEAGTYSGSSNGTVAVGSGAGYYSRGNYNAYFGDTSGLGPETFSTGSNNSFFGQGSGRTNSGSRNTFVGSSAGYSNTVAWDNTIIGASAGFSNTTAGNNVIIGAFAGGLLDSANNTVIGVSAGDNITTGARNIIIGYNVDAPSATASNQLNIGNIIFGTTINGNGTTVSLGNIGIGTTSPNAKLTVHGDINLSQGSGVIQFGGTRFLYASTTNDSIVFGELAGNSLTSGTTFNIAFGYEAGRNMSNSNADFMTLLGYQAGYSNTGDHTNIVGFGAGYSNSGDYSNIIGPSAGIGNTGDYNNLIGAFAGRNNTGGFNNFIGHSVGFQNTGNYNNVVGYYAGYNNTGSNNDMMGYQAGRYLLASSSVVIGAEALYGSHATNFIAPNNVAIGYRAGYTADDGASANILIGYQAADNITTGNNNIIIGYDINAVSATADNRLNIGNLIFGTGLDGTGTTLASGNVGIGTSTPGAKLQVGGTAHVTGTTYIGQYGTDGWGTPFPAGYSSSDNTLVVFTQGSASSPLYGTYGSYAINGATSRNGISALYEEIVTGGGASFSIASAQTGLFQTYHQGGTITDLFGLQSYANVAGGSATNLYGGHFTAVRTAGSLTNAYSLYVEEATGAINNFNIYSNGAGSKNYFAGDVGIGTTTPAQKLQVFGNIRVGTSGSNGCLENFGGGLISGTCSSDEELKENIEPIAREGRSYIESMAALTAVSYNWNQEAAELYSKDRNMQNIGLIAQDVEAQFPELVSLNDDGYRQIDFTSLQFYVIEALKELWEKLKGQDERLNELEQENEYLKERLEVIEDELNIDAPPEPVAPEPPVEEGTGEPEVEVIAEEVAPPEPEPTEPEVILVPGESE